MRLIAASALTRTESRGAHQRTDFPERDPQFDGRHVTITAGGTPAVETLDVSVPNAPSFR